MSEACSGNCSSCSSSDCGSRTKGSLLAPANPGSHVKKVIAVVSGKGGVGKSTVTSMLACAMAKQGHSTAILDADITGPSIPKAFGVNECREATEAGIVPAISKEGIQVMSINLLLDDETAPVLGFVENYSYYQCPDCGKKTEVFGKSHLDAMSQQYNIPILARLPIDPTVAQMADMGCIEQVDLAAIEPAAQALTKE